MGGTIIAALAASALDGAPARAEPLPRAQIVQRGDFVLFGNTLAHDCSPKIPAPVVGTVGNCGQAIADGGADVLWRSDTPIGGAAIASTAIDHTEARSSAVLLLPPGAVATHAFLYWGAQLAIAAADSTVRLERPGFIDVDLAADACFVGFDGSYVCTVDVSELVVDRGPGLFRVSGVEVRPFAGLLDEEVFAGWWMVVVFERPGDPLRSINIFEGLDLILPWQPLETTLSGFIAPLAGLSGRLGVAAFAGDHEAIGDQLLLGDLPVGDGLNPTDDFFNGTRSMFGFPMAVAGDLPRLSGLPASMSGLDLDVFDITEFIDPVQTFLPLTVLTVEDAVALATIVVSAETATPLLEIVELVVDLNGGACVPGDVLEFNVTVTNVGTDAAVDAVLTDVLPFGLTFVPGTLEITDGPQAAVLSDVEGDDHGEHIDGELTVRLGAGADELAGGVLLVGESTTVRFEAVIDDNAEGILVHAAGVSAAGLLGGPPFVEELEAEGFLVEECDETTLCPFEVPLCDLGPTPNVCVECIDDGDCGAFESCDPLSSTCVCEPAGPELCDGFDNDCDGTIDEGFQVGGPCSLGLGECETPGALACDEFGAVVCDGQPALPQFELCDGLDNDCDGTIDDLCLICLADSHCGGPFSGRVCDVDGYCVDGCRALGNGCAFGLVCTSLGEDIGECLFPKNDEEAEEEDDELADAVGDLIECDCRPGTSASGPLLLALAALLRRRRAARPRRGRGARREANAPSRPSSGADRP
ncbi:MopE-related protein [Nannocystis pusilla]|uniref:DUF11 domain-containing protein n=1 Tax=Nannocystis pusilla TaxID=889268 RepID=A0ABS7TUJ0_9BACT|nr:MopE-related protein [Nannocystis pusilla]MBZ5711915.1 DUF11 domain-containing protein [Nannocystis pusilla]